MKHNWQKALSAIESAKREVEYIQIDMQRLVIINELSEINLRELRSENQCLAESLDEAKDALRAILEGCDNPSYIAKIALENLQ